MRRRGIIPISEEAWNNGPIRRAVKRAVKILDRRYSYSMTAYELLCESKLFDELMEGERIPTYDMTITATGKKWPRAACKVSEVRRDHPKPRINPKEARKRMDKILEEIRKGEK